MAGSLGGGLLSGALQYMNSQSAQGMNDQERQRMQSLINQIQQPNFDMSKITPEQYSVLQKYNPQIASFVAEKNPQLMRGNNDQEQRGSDAENEALSSMLQKARSGNDILADIARARAGREAGQEASSNRASVDQLFQRRGAAPGGMMQYGAMMEGASSAAQRNALANEQAAEAQTNRRDQAMTNAGNMGQNIYNQGANLERYNVGAINDFNQRMAQNQNNYGQYAANQANQGQLYNLNQAQGAADKNVANTNAFNQYNQSYGNQQKQQMYNNQMGKLGLMQGASNANQQANNQNAQDKNNFIQGVYTAGSGVADKYQAQQNSDRDYELKKQRYNQQNPTLGFED